MDVKHDIDVIESQTHAREVEGDHADATSEPRSVETLSPTKSPNLMATFELAKKLKRRKLKKGSASKENMFLIGYVIHCLWLCYSLP